MEKQITPDTAVEMLKELALERPITGDDIFEVCDEVYNRGDFDHWVHLFIQSPEILCDSSVDGVAELVETCKDGYAVIDQILWNCFLLWVKECLRILDLIEYEEESTDE